MIHFCHFIQVYVFTTNHHLNCFFLFLLLSFFVVVVVFFFFYHLDRFTFIILVIGHFSCQLTRPQRFIFG